jgi:hypothetical protein
MRKKSIAKLVNMNILYKNLDYKEGKLYRKNGDLAGTFLKSGYGTVSVEGKRMGIHRVIYAMHHGYFPKTIDHIDGNPLNNNIYNLRAATKSQNGMNQKLSVKNTSGYKGISKHGNNWRVCIYVKNKKINIGTYKDKQIANLMAISARNKYQNEFARHE